MNADNHDHDQRHRMQELLAAGAMAELRLLKNERKAERRLAAALDTLADDKARLRKVQQRMERSREAVAAAKANLQDVQARRAAGPVSPQD
jgi:hypothetical protein